MTGNGLTLHIESGPDGQGIAGRLRDDRGEEYRFTGWLGLLTLLERERLAVAADSSGGRPVQDGRRKRQSRHEGEGKVRERNQMSNGLAMSGSSGGQQRREKIT